MTTLRGDGSGAAVTAIAVGGGVGGSLAWRLHGRDDTPVGGVGAVVGLLIAAVPFGVAAITAENGVPVGPDTLGVRVVVAALAAGVAVWVVLLWPSAIGRLRRLGSTGE